MTPILIATGNAHKTAEIRQILGPEYEVTDLSGHREIPVPEETGSSFLENATLKAVGVSLHFEGLVLSDDSGLEVDALGGAPGVLSARYAGENSNDASNRAKLLAELDSKAGEEHGGNGLSRNRSARFHCVMVLARAGTVLGSFEGRVEGRIIAQCKGQGGFGYDPLFIPEGFDQTFAELPGEVKNALSHRARALAKVREFLLAL